MATRSPIIECQDLGKNYNLKGENLVVALNSVTLEGTEKYGAIKQGEFVIIRGPSGGGKTTFLNLLGTIDSSTHGTLSTLHLYSEIEGKEINSTTTDAELSRLRRECIGIVFQTFNLLALMSAYENIELPMRIRGVLKEKEMKERTKMLLKRVGLSERADHLPSELSGGEQQRV
jgi:putative ABC transport system ATP-binding protein